MKMEAACSFKMSESSYKTTKRHNPEDHNLDIMLSYTSEGEIPNSVTFMEVRIMLRWCQILDSHGDEC
jgi:hypothetical protein